MNNVKNTKEIQDELMVFMPSIVKTLQEKKVPLELNKLDLNTFLLKYNFYRDTINFGCSDCVFNRFTEIYSWFKRERIIDVKPKTKSTKKSEPVKEVEKSEISELVAEESESSEPVKKTRTKRVTKAKNNK